MKYLKKFSTNYFIGFISVVSVCLYLGLSLAFPPEPAIRSSHRSEISKHVYKDLDLKLEEKKSDFYGYFSAPIGDIFEYCKMALGKESYPPYQLRPFMPKLIGITYNLLFPNAQTNLHDKLITHEEYVRLTYISMVFNLCFLMGICFLAYRLLPHHNTLSILILSLTVINSGVMHSSPFFLLDIPALFVFALAAYAYFKNNLWLLVSAAMLGLFIKEISIVLLIPIFFLLLKKKSKNILSLIAPIIVFMFIRYAYKTDLLSVQYSWNVSKGDIRLNYLIGSLGTPWLALRTFCISLFCLGPSAVIAFLSFKKSKETILDFLACLFLTLSILLSHAMLGTFTPRSLQVITPFLTFYAAQILEKKERHSENPAVTKA